MTIRVNGIYLRCDRRMCPREFNPSDGSIARAEVRRQAAAVGWTRQPKAGHEGGDLCPRHSPPGTGAQTRPAGVPTNQLIKEK